MLPFAKKFLYSLLFLLIAVIPAFAQPTITSFTPASGPVGTLVTITGTNLSTPTSITIGGAAAIAISNTGTQLVAMVMPGAVTGAVSVTTTGGTANGASNFTVTPSQAPNTQQGGKLVGTGNTGAAWQGYSVSVSADGNTALVGGYIDNGNQGAAWVYTRSGGVWTQQGAKLVGTGNTGAARQGYSVSVSADGNTALVGGYRDNGDQGAAWVYTRSGGVWTQQGAKLVGTGNVGAAYQGYSVSVSADGNTAMVGAYGDNGNQGAAWVYTRSGGVWTQQGAKLVGTGNTGAAGQGLSVSVSADGNTALVGGYIDNGNQGAAWVYTRSGGVWTQQGAKLVGTGNTGAAGQGTSVSVSADGNTAIVGGFFDNSNQGAAWVYTRSGGVWTQQGAKLVGTGNTGAAGQGYSVSVSADGNTALVGGHNDNGLQGSAWVYTRSGGVWTQQGAKLVGTGNTGAARQGYSVSVSADGNTALVGGYSDNGNEGAAWVYIAASCTITLSSAAGTNAQTVCNNTPITNITYTTTDATGATFSGLPAGVTGSWAANTVTISGTPTAAGSFNYTVTLTGGSCVGVTATGSITVTALPATPAITAGGPVSFCAPGSVTLTAAVPPVTDLSFTAISTGTSGANQWQSFVPNVAGLTTAIQIFINGNQGTVAETFNIFTGTGTSGTLVYSQAISITASTGWYNIAIPGGVNLTPGTTYTFQLTGSPLGLVANNGSYGSYFSSDYGLNPGWRLDFITIVTPNFSPQWYNGGTLIAGATSNTYNATTSGTYTNVNSGSGCYSPASNSITVTANPTNTIALSSAAGTNTQTVCNNTSITNITYATTGATGATVTGLPAGVTGVWASDVVTISGTPTEAGTFNYTVTLTGGCGTVTATGTITVSPLPIPTIVAGGPTTFCAGGSVSLAVAGGAGNMLTFNGTNQKVQISSLNISPSILSTLTVSAWVKRTAAIGSWAAIVSNDDGGFDRALMVNADGNYHIFAGRDINTGIPSVIGSWDFMTVTWSLSAVTVYKNGAQVFTTSGESASSGALGTGIGGNAGSNWWFPGSIDQVSFWSTTRSIAQIQGEMNTYLTGNEPGIVGYYNFNEGSGSTTADLTVNARTGSLNNSPTWSVSTAPTGFATYSWSPGGATTNSINVTTAGNYTVTVTGTNTCSATSTATTITANPTPDVNQPANQVVCNNNATAAVTFSGSVSGTNFNWTNNTTSIGLAASGSGDIASFTATNATNAPVTATVTVTPSTGGAFAYIANFVSNNVSVINLATNTVVTTIAVGSGPQGIAISPDNSKVYVTNSNSNTVSQINTATNTVTATIPVGSFPRGVVVSPDGSRLYVANSTSSNVSVINTATNSLITNVPTGGTATWITITPDGNFIYVSNLNSANVAVINTATNTLTTTITVGSTPRGITITPDGSKVYVSNSGASSVSVINTATNTVIGGPIPVGANPNGICTLPDGSIVYVANQGSGNVSRINTTTNTVVGSPITVGAGPNGIYRTPDGSKVYVANNSGSSVSMINTGTNTVGATVTVGSNPIAIGNFITTSGQSCTGSPKTFTITVNPTPNALATPSSQTRCSGVAIQTIALTGNVSGTVYNWTRNNGDVASGTVTGIAASGSGDISGTLTNTTTSPVTVTFTVTPSYTNAGVTCTGTPITATVLVNPTSTITLSSAAGTDNQTVLINTPITDITYSTTIATGATITGLPAGVTGSWSANVVTISGTPTTGVGSPFNYTVTLTGGCGTVTATGTITVNSIPATALNFDGVDDYVKVPNPYFTFNKEITVEWWVNLAGAQLGSGIGQALDNVDDMNTNVWLMHSNGGNSMTWFVNDNGSWRNTGAFSIAPGWHHIVGTAGISSVKIYIDGVLVSSGPGISSGIRNAATSSLFLGRDARFGAGRFMNASMDEIRIWNRELCQAEVQNNMNCELNPAGQTGLVSLYRLNNGFVNGNNAGLTLLQIIAVMAEMVHSTILL